MSKTVLNLKNRLIQKAQKLTGLKNKAAIVNLALEYLIQSVKISKKNSQGQIRRT